VKRSLRPRVIANFALTADGKVSTRNFTSAGFTSPGDKDRLREIRALSDAVLVGARTVVADNMSLSLSSDALRKKRVARGLTPAPLRVIASHKGAALHPKLKVFQTKGAPVVIFAGQKIPQNKRAALAGLCDLWIFDEEKVALDAMLQILHQDYGVRTVVCEGGPSLLRSLLEIKALDELRITLAPIVFGGAKAPTLTGRPGDFLPATMRGRLVKTEVREGECFLTYRF